MALVRALSPGFKSNAILRMRRCLPVRSDLRRQQEQRLIAAARSSQLHAAVCARDNHRGHPGEAKRCSVSQQATPRLAMIHANREAHH